MLIELVRNEDFSAEVLKAFLDTCVERQCLQIAFLTSSLDYRSVDFDYNNNSTYDFDSSDEDEDEAMKEMELNLEETLDSQLMKLDSAYRREWMFKVGGSMTPIEFGLFAETLNHDKLEILFVTLLSRRKFCQNLLMERSFRWLKKMFQKERVNTAKVLFEWIDRAELLEGILQTNSSDLFLLAARYSPSCLQFIINVLQSRLAPEEVFNSSRAFSIVSVDVDYDSLCWYVQQLKERNLLREALTEQNDEGKTALLVAAENLLLNADAIRFLLKIYAEEGILQQSLRATVVDWNSGEVDSIITLARKGLCHKFYEEAKERYSVEQLIENGDKRLDTIKIIVAHCERADIDQETIKIWTEEVDKLKELKVFGRSGYGEPGDFFDGDCFVNWNPCEDDEETSNMEDEDDHHRYKKPASARAWRQKQCWSSCYDWFKKKYREEPVLDKEF